MPADAPTILATSGGIRDGRRPRGAAHLYEAAHARGVRPSHLTLFPMPNVDDITAHLLGQDVVWVFGGSVAGLLTMWRLHGVDAAMRTAGHAGVVLTGISAGSICPLFQRLIADGTLPAGYATDDGAGVLYRGTDFVEAVSERDSAASYFVESDGRKAVEVRLDTRRL